MPIKNYSSKVKPRESISLIQSLLAEYGANEINLSYSNGKPTALIFNMFVKQTLVYFKLVVDVDGLLAAMKKDKKVPKNQCTIEQAERTAWKNKYEWLRIQIAEIEANQARIEQLLLGYAVTNNGQTAFERLSNDNKLLQ